MKIKSVARLFMAVCLAISMGSAKVALAQETRGEEEVVFKTEELDQMLAPIALFPDELLANVLMASTYPLEVVQAARWRITPTNAELKDETLAKALEEKDWDPSVKALVMFPDLLQTMSEKLDWTQKLGDAFLAQEDEVFERVQYLRQKADQAGHLKTTKQQNVTKSTDPETRTEYIVIEPATPDVVYVPVYQPTVVYGSWWYPSNPPYYWNWYPGASFTSGFFWGAGFAIANDLWGWGRCDWRRRNIDIDINRYNRINVNQARITNNTWQHNPRHRGSVPYRDASTRDKFAKDRNIRDKSNGVSGIDRSKVRDRTDVERVRDRLEGSGTSKAKDRVKDRDISKAKGRVGEHDVSKAKEKVRDSDISKAKHKVGGGMATPKTKKPVERKNVSKPKASSRVIDTKPNAAVKRRPSNSGNVSRKPAASQPRARTGGGAAKHVGGGRGRPH